jgi:hypothetical protein
MYDLGTYYLKPSALFVLDTKPYSWDLLNIAGGEFYNVRYAAISQFNSSTSPVHTFSGYSFDDSIYHVFRQLMTMNVVSGKWIEENCLLKKNDNMTTRYTAASAIVLNKYFVVFHGMIY